MSKKLKYVLLIILELSLVLCTRTYAHGGNITDWKNKDSTEITEYDGKYYGYHNENSVRHYHEVQWDEERQKWVIINPAVYYDENFNAMDNLKDEDSKKVSVKYYASVDGDTAKFELDGEIVTVRFLGIDTPETVHTQKEEQPYGKEASYYGNYRLYSYYSNNSNIRNYWIFKKEKK